MKTIKMKSVSLFTVLFVFVLALAGCNDDWLVRNPSNIITEEQVWNDPVMIEGLLANYYDRIPRHQSISSGWFDYANFTDAMWSGQQNEEWRNNLATYGYNWWGNWDYGLIRDMNLAIENIDQYSTELQESDKAAYKAELRFLRAWMYFELVKRMGGVPLITETLEYDFSGDPSSLQYPRDSEEAVYDFIGSELDDIMDDLGNAGSQTRANKYTALALKSRAMLYAGSLAKYNNQMANPITLPNGVVGIPANRAQGYYQAALDAAEEVITNSPYSLYRGNPDPGVNFYEATTHEDNMEVILAEDFDKGADRRHWFAYDNIARPVREDNLGSSSITPSLNLVEAFPYKDGSSGELQTRTADGSDYIYYDNLEDIFANKDGRLYGTVLYPGTTFRGLPVPMQAGVKVWNAGTNSYDTIEGARNSTYDDGGVLTADGGPVRVDQNVSNTGFYLRKFVSDAAGASTRGERSDNWWIIIRLSEMYLNAAEASFELNQPGDAADYINELRDRAGYEQSGMLTGSTIDMATIRNERRIELAFEDHRLWDLKRWRIAHEVWNGGQTTHSANVYALYPYRVVNSADATKDGKYVFDKIRAPRFEAPRQFRMGNYYSEIDQGVLNNNPKLIRNPFH